MSISELFKTWAALLVLRLKAAWDSLFSRTKAEGDDTYIRAYYPAFKKALQQFNFPGLRAIEFGGSNQIVKSFLPQAQYEIAPNFPEVDIQNLKDYKDQTYDLVVLDMVLEHCEDPFKSMKEIHRVLKPGGTLAATVPFLLYIHPTPDDYWRFTESGIKKLCENFSKVEVSYWGNRVAMGLINKYGMGISFAQARWLLSFSLRNENKFPIAYWFLAKK